MAFRGVFIGIDQYLSKSIRWLNFACSDAIAMHALFTDTFGDGSTLLTNEAATKEAIENEFRQLALCQPDDVVVIYFSGHGSNTHELITHDANKRQLASTAIPLDTLTSWFSSIPAKRLICVLDCCFSGGMGAKVLQSDAMPRNISSTEDALNQLSGDGRLILTASSPTEEAWEHTKVGHGLLTYYLLEALQGAQEVRQAGKVSVYRLLEYVSQNVKTDSAQLGKIQHPSLRAVLDDSITFPIFVPGTRYHNAFPQHKRATASKSLKSLEEYSFPATLLNVWAGAIDSLNQLQLDAINEFGVLRGEHLVVSAPTSSGKTMVGELAALKGCLARRRAFFLLPLKALVNDKHQQFNRMYGGFGIKTIRATGEIADDIPELIQGRYDICLMTYEKFYALVLAFPHLLEQVGTIVIDEVQMLADESRGANLEFILTLLRIRRRDHIEPQIIALSAVIGKTNGLEQWLGAQLLLRTERPVPLDEGILRADGSFRYVNPSGDENVAPAYIQPQRISGKNQEWVIPLVQKLVSEGKQVIVFREQRGETRGCALYLARALGLNPAQEALDALPVGDPSGSANDLRLALSGGVAFHNSNLDRDERLVVESQFRAPNSSLRVIVATTTLAMGINTPTEAVVIVGLLHPGAVPKAYTVAEYKNIVGRAGRLGYSNKGMSFLLALTDNDEQYMWSHYVNNQPEDLHSHFLSPNTDPRSLIVRVLATTQRFSGKGLNINDLIAFLEGSFGAYHQKQENDSWEWNRIQLIQALDNLTAHNLVECFESELYRLTPLGRLSGEGGIEVATIIRLVDAVKPLSPQDFHEATIIAATQLAVELDDVYFPMNKKSTKKEPEFWLYQLQQHNVAVSVINAMQKYTTEIHQPTLRAKKAAACLLWMTDIPLVEIEKVITQHGGATDGASGSIRAVRSRSCDLLPIVIRVAELLHPTLDFGERTKRLLTRLEIGLSAAAADLAMLLGSSLTRADYQALVRADVKTFDAIKASSDDAILACFVGDNAKEPKLKHIRKAVQIYQERDGEEFPLISIIPPYDS